MRNVCFACKKHILLIEIEKKSVNAVWQHSQDLIILYIHNPNQLSSHFAKGWSFNQDEVGYVLEINNLQLSWLFQGSLYLALTKPVASQDDSLRPPLAQNSWPIPFCSTFILSCTFTIATEGEKELEGVTLSITCSRIELTCVTSAHNSLTRTSLPCSTENSARKYKFSRCPEKEEN